MKPEEKPNILFVGYENQENLGIRYIISYLESQGIYSELIPFNLESSEFVVNKIKDCNPDIVGFSIIFQYTLYEFGELMQTLRKHKINSHFTTGGHYPSLRPQQTFTELLHLDSIVLFEGELTTAELVKKIKFPHEWNSILGLAYRKGNEIIINNLRPLIQDLDTLPWPKRGNIQQSARGFRAAPILASRGCLHNCSFCSIRQFYGNAPGTPRRSRSPQNVVSEMKSLYDNLGVQLFLFQDDDFAAKSPIQRRWVNDFLCSLEDSGLKNKIGWKISCRVDDIDSEIMQKCKEYGLLVVYMGIESGNSQGLKTLNKQATVEQNLISMQLLRELNIEFDLGFMLFDPDSTIESVHENINFLKKVSEISGPPIAFVKMLPLAGTAIEKRLLYEKRLYGNPIRPDYDFTDKRLDYYALFVMLNFSERNSHPNGLVEKLRQTYFDCMVANFFYRDNYIEYKEKLTCIINKANRSIIDALEKSICLVENLSNSHEVALAWPKLNIFSKNEYKDQKEITFELYLLLERYNPDLYNFFLREDARFQGKKI